ncbi:MAG: general secretion pathway protein GspK [Gammaproteobacteria bacterium]|nr:general secretion pathway protein GspK [Gammaproteobacteria bacterium]
MRRIHRASSKGFALITVLWITAFLAVIAGSVSYQARASLGLASNVVASFKTKHAAEGALLLTVDKLIKRDELQGYVLKNPNFNYELDNLTISVEVADESGKVDLNLASVDLIKSLFVAVGVNEKVSSSIADAIADWRDQDNLKRADGAEDQDYAANGLLYEAKDDEFDSIDELSLVLGVTPEIFNRVKPHITVYAQDIGVNTTLASVVVKNAVQNIIGTSNSDEASSDYISSTGGLIYTLRAKATDPSGLSTVITSIVRLQRGNIFEPFAILGWKQS